MVNIEIFLDGNLIDITEEVSFRFNYQFSDIEDITAKRTSFSKPFIVPGTKRNNKVFDNLFDLQIKSDYQIQKRADVLVKIDGIDLISGWARIERIKIKDDQANVASYYEIIISDEVNNIFNNLKSKRLNTLDLSDFDHEFNLTNVTNSWNTFIKFKGQNTPVRNGFGYDYPLVDLGGKFSKPNNIDWFLTGFKPWIFTKTIVDQIFLEEGATYEGFFDSEYFRKMITSPNPEGLTLTEEEMNLKKFDVGLRTATYSATYPYAGYVDSGITYSLDYYNPPKPVDTVTGAAKSGFTLDKFAYEIELGYNEYQTFSTQSRHNGAIYTGPDYLKKRVPFRIKTSQNGRSYFDNGNQFNETTFNYISASPGIENISITIPSMLRVHIPAPQGFNTIPLGGPNAPNWGFVGNDPADWAGSGIKDLGRGNIYGIYRTWCLRAATGSLELLDTRVENYLWEPDNPAYSYLRGGGNTKHYWVYEYVPPTPVPDDTTDLYLNTGDEVFVELSYLMNLDNDNAKWVFDRCYSSIVNLSTGVDEFKNEPKDNYFIEGRTITLTRLLPDVSRLEFLSSLFSMFNLYIIEDKIKKGHYIIKTRDSFFDFSNPFDWTYKLDRTEYEKKPLPLLNKKEYILSYKPDKDYFNKTYDEKAGKTWGEYTKLIESSDLSGQEKLNLIFSPSPLLTDSVTNRRVSRIFDWQGLEKKEISYNPRILFKKFINHTTYGVNNFNIIHLNGTYSATSHSTATHLDNPYDPLYDLNFYYNTDPGFYYINHPLVNRNLYNMFWKNTLDNLTDPDNFMLIGFFNLNLKDIWDFDFRRTIFIDNQYYYVNKIIDWNPDRRLTKVELVKIKNYNPGEFLGIIVSGRQNNSGKVIDGVKIGPVDPTKSIDIGIVKGGVGGTKVKDTVIATGKTINLNNSGNVIISGDDISLGDVNNSAVGGQGITIVNSNSVNVSGTNVGVYSSNNTTVRGSSVSVSSAYNSFISGENITLNESVNNSIIIGKDLYFEHGGIIGTFSTATTSNPGDFRTANFQSALFVGENRNLFERYYTNGVISDNHYFPDGPVISGSTGSVTITTTTGSNFVIGTNSINFPGAVRFKYKQELVTATSSYQIVQTRDDDFFIEVIHTDNWLGATGIGQITLPDAALNSGRQLIYKVSSTYSIGGWWSVSNATNTINGEFSYDLNVDNSDLIFISSDGISNWNIISAPFISTGSTGPAGATGATGPAGATGSAGSISTIQSVTNGTTVTGTLVETISMTASIPDSTYATGDIVDLVFRVIKDTSFSNVTVKAYIGTSASSTSGAIQIAQLNMTSGDKWLGVSRILAIKNETTDTEVFDTTFNLPDDRATGNNYSNLSIDWTTQNYLLITIQNNSVNDAPRGSMYRIFKT